MLALKECKTAALEGGEEREITEEIKLGSAKKIAFICVLQHIRSLHRSDLKL